MSLHLYLDDCANSDHLATLLRGAGHTVTIPADVGLAGVSDARHLAHAIEHGMVLLTKNPADFLELHEQDRKHHGILGVYQDNDAERGMNDGAIVAAIGNLEATYSQAGTPIAGSFHSVNEWRVREKTAESAKPAKKPRRRKDKGK